MTIAQIGEERAAVRIGDSLFVNDDCVHAARVHLPDNSVDLIVTDPPYGIDGDRLHRHYNRDESYVIDGYVEVPAATYNTFSRSWIAEAERVLRPGGQLYIVSGYTNLYDVLDGLRATSLREINHIIWKYNFGVFTSSKYVSSHYHLLYYAKPGGRRTFNTECRFGLQERDASGALNYQDREDVWIINREYKPGRTKNKNELPSELLQKILAYSSSEGDTVCDFFLGGGSTARVAIGMNRRCIGFEVSTNTFDSRVPTLHGVEGGHLLREQRVPRIQPIENQGKPWDESDLQRLLTRYTALRELGSTKSRAVDALCSEFKRGTWSIRKALKRYAVAD